MRRSAALTGYLSADTIRIGGQVPPQTSSHQVNEAYETLIDCRRRHAYDLSLRWAERPAPVRVEPMVAQSGPFHQEDAAVFGRFERAPHGGRPSSSFDELFDRWFHSLDDLFFGSEWPW
jgi:DnaJ-class molecular chaperone